MFQHYDLPALARLTAEGDQAKLTEFVRRTGEPTEFAIFFQLDQGSTQRLAGSPIESRFYLFGNVSIAQGLFRYSASAGLGAPVRFCVSVVVAALVLTGCNANQAINPSSQPPSQVFAGHYVDNPYDPISYAQNNTGRGWR